MKIKIKKNAYVFASCNEKLWQFLKEREGKWLEVETEHLFHDQYNTAEFRIYDSMVSEVKNDARIGRGKCRYCGTMLKTGEVCTKYTAENPHQIGDYPKTTCAEYGIDWFTPENTYFLKYPKGANTPKGCEVLSIHTQGSKKIGSYYLESYPSLDYFRLYNCRQTLNFTYDNQYFYISNGIGFKQVRQLPIPHALHDKIRQRLKEYQETKETTSVIS